MNQARGAGDYPKAQSLLSLLMASKYSFVFFLAVTSALQNDPHFMAVFECGAINRSEFFDPICSFFCFCENIQNTSAETCI